MEIIGGICMGYFLKPYVDIIVKIIKNSFKNK
jgi:hypothetical protein